MGSLIKGASPVVDDINIEYDTAHLEVLAPDGLSTTYTPNLGQQFNIVLKARDTNGTMVLAEHAGAKTVQLTASVAQPNTGCASSFNGGTTYNAAVSFVDGEVSIPVTLCDAAVSFFTINVQETTGGALDSTGGYELTIPSVSSGVSALTGVSVSLSPDVAGQSTTATIAFTTATALSAGDFVEITFDGDFDISGATSGDGTVNTALNVLTLTLGAAASGNVSLDIDNIVNPSVPQTTSAYDIVTKIGVVPADVGTAAGNDIVAAFSFTSPGVGGSWAVNEKQALSWTTSGTVNNVDISYATELDSYVSWTTIVSDCSMLAGDPCASGAYTWTVDDILVAKGIDPQADNDILVRVRIEDSDTGHPAAAALSNILTVKYYAVTWRVRDVNNMPVYSLDVNEPAVGLPNKALWTESGAFSGNDTIRYYPYNGDSVTDSAYSTTFSRLEGSTTYTIANTGWRADSDKTMSLTIGTAATAAMNFLVNIDANYDAANDAIDMVVWLMKEGGLVAKEAGEPTSLQSVSVDIFDALLPSIIFLSLICSIKLAIAFLAIGKTSFNTLSSNEVMELSISLKLVFFSYEGLSVSALNSFFSLLSSGNESI